jgi:hypothetical protein
MALTRFIHFVSYIPCFFVTSCFTWKAATQVDNSVLPVPPAKIEAAEIQTLKVEETLDVIGADVGDAMLQPETADV